MELVPEGDSGSPAAEGSPLPFEGQDTAATAALTGDHPAHGSGGLVTQPLTGTILRLALPAVASALLMTTFASVDAFWVGRSIGPSGLAAVTSSLFWIWMLISIAEMIAVGLTAIAARRYGEGRGDEAALVSGEALIYALALGGVLGVVGAITADKLLLLLGVPQDVYELARTYLRIYILGAPLIFGFFAVDAAFRASGNSRTPFVLLATSVSVTLVLDPVLIMGLWGAPELGIAGAAISTVSTRAIAFALGVYILIRSGRVRFARVRGSSIRSITRIGLPLAMWGVTFSLIYVGLARIATPFGTVALASLGIGHRVESWLYMTAVGLGAAAAAIVGQNLGAGRVDRAERSGWLTSGYTFGLGLALSIVSLLMAEELAGLFTTDPAVIEEGARYLRISILSNIFLGAEVVLEASMGGAGSTLPPMLTSTALTAARIPLAIWLSAQFGIVGIWWTIALTAALRGVAMMYLWRAGHWKRRVV